MSKPLPHFVVTANRLSDGRVLYAGPGPAWVERFAGAEVTADAERRDVLLAWARADVLHACGAYVVDLAIDADGQQRMSQRERLRAAGADTVLSRLNLTASALSARTEQG